jgi:tRNA (pseudouridine54-N1)-methyltransferase
VLVAMQALTHGHVRVSLGPERIHADHAIVVAHNYLDTDGYATD